MVHRPKPIYAFFGCSVGPIAVPDGGALLLVREIAKLSDSAQMWLPAAFLVTCDVLLTAYPTINPVTQLHSSTLVFVGKHPGLAGIRLSCRPCTRSRPP